MAVSQPRGVRDFTPSEAIAKKEIISVIEEVFKRFGFYPLETPALENFSVLSAKAYGEESSKDIFKIEDDDSALRFDLTVPLARFLAMNRSVPLPFKRYQIASVWRRDEPQKMRFREFTQADVDIVGSKGLASDAEVLAATATALEELGIRNYLILLNSRIVLDKILDSFGIDKSKHNDAMRIIDKLSKLTKEELTAQLTKLGMQGRDAEKLLEFLQQDKSNNEKLEALSANIPGAKEEVERLNKMIDVLEKYGITDKISVEFSLARGLQYYTGFVWEIVLVEDNKRLPSIAGGGRYDELLGLYAKQTLPAVGSSIGVGRIFEVLSGEQIEKTYARLFVAYIKEENYEYALSIATKARASGVYTDLEVMDRSLSKQLEHVNAMKFKFAMIIGNQERESNKVKLRDLITGNEVLLNVSDAIDVIKRGRN